MKKKGEGLLLKASRKRVNKATYSIRVEPALNRLKCRENATLRLTWNYLSTSK